MSLSSYIFELRFQPSPKVLDIRGQIAEALANEVFTEWAVTQDAVQVSSTSGEFVKIFRHHAFVFVASKQSSKDFFVETAKQMCRDVWNFFPHNQIKRIGVRSSFLHEVDSFDDLTEKYKSKFVGLSDQELGSLNGDLIDIGLPLNFKSGDNFFNVLSGPMKKQQAKDMMHANDDQGLPDAALFVDVDYFTKEQSAQVRQSTVLQFIDAGTNRAEEIDAIYNNWLFPSEE